MDKAHIDYIQSRTGLALTKVNAVIKLLEDGCTVPFIARYRKEMTGSLDEVAIMDIKQRYQQLESLLKRKETILKSIEEQNLLTESLRRTLIDCLDKNQLEDLYLPFKKKIKTRATVARDNGLEPLAKIMMAQKTSNLKAEANRFIKGNVSDVEMALQGARDIIASWVNENLKARDLVRGSFDRYAVIQSKVVTKKKAEAQTYKTYFDHKESLKHCPSHRTLAMYRGEQAGLLKVKLSIDESFAKSRIEQMMIRSRQSPCATHIATAIEDGLKRLLIPAVENEFKKKAKLKADIAAIDVFSKNLKVLLLAAPLGQKITMALDPGYKSGCKLVILNSQGSLLHNETIYPHPPQKKTEASRERIKALVSDYKVEAIAVGNGTAGKETLALVKAINFPHTVERYTVNESGASIYSASKLARDEFPDKDVTVRGAVSIGRRLMDPLAELVKIDAKSIGVGQYQHDVDQKLLRESLDTTVISAVNSVGINLNTASATLLSKVSGIGPTLANNIVSHRDGLGKFTSRKQLNKVPRLGAKAYEQCAGFLRVRNGDNPLDDTGIHPESYLIVKRICKTLNTKVEKLIGNASLINEINPEDHVTSESGLPTIMDILMELKKPGLDPRGEAEEFHFSEKINKISDLKVGMQLTGIITNVTKFGAFVDLGIKQSGLLHISEISEKRISDPAQVLSVNQKVAVHIINIDEAQERISLSMRNQSG